MPACLGLSILYGNTHFKMPTHTHIHTEAHAQTCKHIHTHKHAHTHTHSHLRSMPDMANQAFDARVQESSMGVDFEFDDEEDTGSVGSRGSEEDEGGEVEVRSLVGYF